MKFLHVADLHIGKVVNDFSMLEDQKYILDQIVEMAAANQADALVIAGDIYDRAIPAGEAVTLFDAFLTKLSGRGIQVLLISGNHDSPERISYGEAFFGRQGVHLAGVCKETLTRVSFPEKDRETEFVLLPFVKPALVGAYSSQEAVSFLLGKYWQEEERQAGTGKETRDKNRVLVTHFFVTDAGREPELSDSETTVHVGGLDNVEASVFSGFDYVALGHIHKPQQIGDKPVRYAGSPLKYSFGETNQTKAALLVELGEKGLCGVREIPFRPLREMRKIKGTLAELLREGEMCGPAREDYIQAVLTDKGELIDPIGALRSVYLNIMQIVREEKQSDSGAGERDRTVKRMLIRQKDPVALFEDFYREVRDEELSEEGKRIITEVVKEAEEM